MDQGSTRKRSAVHNFSPTVTKFCVMWEGQALPHDTKFGNGRCEIAGRRVIFICSLIHGSSWSGLIKAEPESRFSKYLLDCGNNALIMCGYGLESWDQTMWILGVYNFCKRPNLWVHPSSKVIGFFCNAKIWYLVLIYRYGIFHVVWRGRLYLLWKIS